MEETEIATALTDADYDFFVCRAASTADTALFSADIGFVHFNRSVQHRFVSGGHSLADTVTEIPCGLIRALVLSKEYALNLIRAHALAGLANQVGSDKPLEQRQMGIMEDRSGGDTELIIAILAVQKFFSQARKLRSLAPWAFGTIRPAETLKQFSAFFISRKKILNIYNRHRVISDE
jgi:hypothetical protein